MENKNFNSNNNTDDNSNNEIDNIIKTKAIDAANIEKVGAAFLSLGYATFFEAGNADILETLGENTSGLTAFGISAFGQQFTLWGYLLLYIAASIRLYIRTLANLYASERNDLLALKLIRDAYLGSIFVNYIRLTQFRKISQEEQERS